MAVEYTQLSVDALENTLLVDSQSTLAVDNTLNASMDTGLFGISPNFIGTYLNSAAYIIPESYAITPANITFDVNRRLFVQTGNYNIVSFFIKTEVQNKIVEGRYIKDSANYFTLYVDSGTDYTILVDSSKLGISDFKNMTFSGTFAKHFTSLNKYNIVIDRITDTLIRIKILNTVSAGLYGKYNFDILSTKNGVTSKLLWGDVIINQIVRA